MWWQSSRLGQVWRGRGGSAREGQPLRRGWEPLNVSVAQAEAPVPSSVRSSAHKDLETWWNFPFKDVVSGQGHIQDVYYY